MCHMDIDWKILIDYTHTMMMLTVALSEMLERKKTVGSDRYTKLKEEKQ